MDAVDVAAVDVSSDVVDVVAPASGLTAPSPSYGFPLGGGGPFLCTRVLAAFPFFVSRGLGGTFSAPRRQGAGGLLSHYAHASTYYAVDFRCPEGTPVLAIGAGVVDGVRCGERESSIHVSALFKWNAIVLRLDDGARVERVSPAPPRSALPLFF